MYIYIYFLLNFLYKYFLINFFENFMFYSSVQVILVVFNAMEGAFFGGGR